MRPKARAAKWVDKWAVAKKRTRQYEGERKTMKLMITMDQGMIHWFREEMREFMLKRMIPVASLSKAEAGTSNFSKLAMLFRGT
eukprot:scaffold395360_cov33-Attheya_sp.AAC.1